MPIYEFRCIKCGHIFELLKLKKEDGKSGMKCPKCGCEEVERVLSTISVGTSSSVRKAKQTIKSCGGGSCATFEIPGPKR